jgi:hypothetical protein
VFGFMRGYVFVALFAANTEIGGFDLQDTLTYVFIGQGLIMAVYRWGWWWDAPAITASSAARRVLWWGCWCSTCACRSSR